MRGKIIKTGNRALFPLCEPLFGCEIPDKGEMCPHSHRGIDNSRIPLFHPAFFEGINQQPAIRLLPPPRPGMAFAQSAISGKSASVLDRMFK